MVLAQSREQDPETSKRSAEAGGGAPMSGLTCLLNCPELINGLGQGTQDF